MKTLQLSRGTILVAGLLAALALLAPEGRAQARKAARPAAEPAASRDKVAIRKIEGIGNLARIKTPVYDVSGSDQNLTQSDWARVRVRFETDAEWTDELVFHYYVQVRNPKTSRDLLFTGDFTYVDIPRGKNHHSTAFLRPATLERYGDIVGIAVEIEVKGEKVAMASSPESPVGWWLQSKAAKAPGVLLERSQTPFALVDIDAYITAKPK